MKKDLDKIMSSTLSTYFIILGVVFILKICGLDYFGLDDNNKILIAIDSFVNKYHLHMLWYGITLALYTYIILSISCADNSKTMKIFTLITMPLSIISQFLKYTYNMPFIFIFTDLLWLFMLEIVYIKFVKKNNLCKHHISNYWLYCIINLLFQFISVIIRNIPFINCKNYIHSGIANIILNFDYIMLSVIAYKLFFQMGGNSLWDMVVGSFLRLQTLLKSLPKKLQNAYQNNKSKNKVDKLTNMIYIPLYLLWNIFTVFVILFIAFLNDTFIECVIILCSFWLNKKLFGKPFHMKTALSCFVISNISYYCLNRITIPSNISLIISVLLGILLNYIASFFVDNKNKKLYRGMTIEVYDNIVLNITDKNSIDYIIGKLFYVDGYSEKWISTKLNYSVPSIQKKKYKLRDSIKELN